MAVAMATKTPMKKKKKKKMLWPLLLVGALLEQERMTLGQQRRCIGWRALDTQTWESCFHCHRPSPLFLLGRLLGGGGSSSVPVVSSVFCICFMGYSVFCICFMGYSVFCIWVWVTLFFVYDLWVTLFFVYEYGLLCFCIWLGVTLFFVYD